MSNSDLVEKEFLRTLATRIESMTSELEDVEESLSQLRTQRDGLRAQLAHMQALANPERLSSEGSNELPSGEEISDLVYGLLESHGSLHFKNIEQLLRETAGVQASGSDPATSLLARYYNDPRFYRPKRGTYAIRRSGSAKSVGARKKRKSRAR